ncbi:adenylate kinase [Candidatus Shapirobacteria bacterium CG08_land_8_20_14_0_20_39_18]|uniref:Adenylate kinase n=1 Tax=Candidatus Shapirobacteria bacterium CG08_land_8_20_14_0_20_39_18 TaxID=1974883 RepID=A0A2M6XEC4_9BACT|nr:MAG: adenylate kinase [Candidatus Shapirobacteria bacterium CG08_land_8_20_14_0_20_39_18]PIY66422.1 MAG: adenylate kinase [Candidatus Shapirobacteria bacterium CG_4_10_14_0_8_um_filter_39_15]
MNLIISGPQGSGKGTQGDLLEEKFGVFHLESGQLMREAIKKETDFGRQIADYVNQGIIVPDELTNQLIEQSLVDENISKGIIFDGFPRRLSQGQWLDEQLVKKNSQIDKLILLILSTEETIRRLSARRICPKCGRNFNLITVPPKNDELCDDCGLKLITRDDETSEAITKRLEEYHTETDPMIEYYRKQGKVIEINGEQPVEKVFSDILEALASQGVPLRS